MVLDIDYKTFCDSYYKEAEAAAEKALAGCTKSGLSKYVDAELVKDLAVCYALEKVFYKYDVDNEKRGSISAFLSKVVHNTVVTEFGKERTSVKVGKKTSSDFLYDEEAASYGDVRNLYDAINVEENAEKKEDLIKEMLACVRKLPAVDQVIIISWMSNPKATYTQRAIEELGWEDTVRTRNVVNVRCTRAINTLRKMMEKRREAVLEISIPNKMTDISGVKPKAHGETDYNYLRRRRRAAVRSITGKVDYKRLAAVLSSALAD